jgi:hypothetical protein
MKLKNRILYYLIGFGIGLIVTILLFQGRGCEWTPGNRVKSSIQSSKMLISPREQCRMQCLSIADAQVFELVNNGSVDFGKSITKETSTIFSVEGMDKSITYLQYYMSYNGLALEFWYSKNDSLSIVHTVDTSCPCEDKADRELELFYMPGDLVLSTLKEQELWINKEMECQLQCFNMDKSIFEEVLTHGKVLLKESFPYRKPNPIYFIQYPKNGIDWVFWIEKGATKTRMVHMADMTGVTLSENEYLVNKLFTKIQEENICGCYQ